MSSHRALPITRHSEPAFKDSLTGVHTHAFFHVTLEREIDAFRRYGRGCTIFLIGLDYFSHFNQKYGHLRGDKLLAHIGRWIEDSVRKVDFVARYSGDMFGVIMPNTEPDGAIIVTERVRRFVEKRTMGELTISAGIASCPREAVDKEQLIAKAEEALWCAKTRGKNQTFVHKPLDTKSGKCPRILIVDDEPVNLEIMDALLDPLNCEVIKVRSGEEALSFVSKADVDLVLLDIMMPGIDGYEVCRYLKCTERTRLIPVILLTGLEEREAKIKGIEAGADDFIRKPPDKAELLARTRSLINVKSINDNLINIENVLFSLAAAVEAKDLYTQGHIMRVSRLAIALGNRIGLTGEDLEALKYGGMLHDIGKIGVSEQILNKPGPLDEQEWKIIKRHPEIGHQICSPLIRTLGPALDAIRHHHEKLDGSGYPDGLKGERLSVVARILAVIDIYDALTTDRPYRRAMVKEQALHILDQEAKEGKLDNELVKAFSDMLGKQRQA